MRTTKGFKEFCAENEEEAIGALRSRSKLFENAAFVLENILSDMSREEAIETALVGMEYALTGSQDIDGIPPAVFLYALFGMGELTDPFADVMKEYEGRIQNNDN